MLFLVKLLLYRCKAHIHLLGRNPSVSAYSDSTTILPHLFYKFSAYLVISQSVPAYNLGSVGRGILCVGDVWRGHPAVPLVVGEDFKNSFYVDPMALASDNLHLMHRVVNQFSFLN